MATKEAEETDWTKDPEWQGIETRIEEGWDTQEILEAWRFEALRLFAEFQETRAELVKYQERYNLASRQAEGAEFAALASRALAENTRAEAWKAAALLWREAAELTLESPRLFESEARASKAILEAEEADRKATEKTARAANARGVIHIVRRPHG